MTKKTKKWLAAVALLVIGAISVKTYCSYDSRSTEEIADHYAKEWVKLLNVHEEVAFNVKEDDGSPKKLDSKYGTFYVKLKETREFLDGYKITFSVGNLSEMTLPNPKVKIHWSRNMKTYSLEDLQNIPKEYRADWNKKCKKEDEDWSKSLKEKEFTNLKDLTKGSWTDLEFIILPCSPGQFEHVEFSIIG